MKLKNKIIFWAVFILLFIACVHSLFGVIVFVGLALVFHKKIIKFFKEE